MHEVTEFVLPSYATLQLEIEQHVAVVTLNRPQVMNALNAQMFSDLESVFTLLMANPAVRVVVLTGSGEKAFAAGADIAELAAADAAAGEGAGAARAGGSFLGSNAAASLSLLRSMALRWAAAVSLRWRARCVSRRKRRSWASRR